MAKLTKLIKDEDCGHVADKNDIKIVAIFQEIYSVVLNAIVSAG